MRTIRAAAILALAALALVPQAAEARDTVHRFAPADAAARAAWAELVKQDADLARDVRRKKFDPRRDLRALRLDLDEDGRAELLLYADLITYCGSAGCVVRILTRRADRWVVACETYLDDGIGLVVAEKRSAGWHDLRGTYPVTWRKDGAARAGVACIEGAAIPRAEQGR